MLSDRRRSIAFVRAAVRASNRKWHELFHRLTKPLDRAGAMAK
jgi:hypothetical protein